MNALAENQRIRSVRDGLAEGISGLRLYMNKPSRPEFNAESKRGLGILQDFCQYFVASVEFERAIAQNNRDVLARLEVEIVKDLSLYSGIVSTLSNEERTDHYNTIKEILEFLGLAIQSNNETGKEPEKFISTLEELYKLVEVRTREEQQTTERIILGNDGHF
jgi:hypothetical protein